MLIFGKEFTGFKFDEMEICEVDKPVLYSNNLSGLWKAIGSSGQSFSITRQEQTITEQAGTSRRSKRC